MSTDRQFEANRSNARKSTGPRSAAGKARAGENALKHGLVAATSFSPARTPRNMTLFAPGWSKRSTPKAISNIS
jgi:hypothetical protein